jgi:hypothetical protein
VRPEFDIGEKVWVPFADKRRRGRVVGWIVASRPFIVVSVRRTYYVTYAADLVRR